MSDPIITHLPDPSGFSPDPLTDLERDGARQLIRQAVEAALAVLLERHAGDRLESGRARLFRHGHLPEREVLTGIGPVPVKREVNPHLRSPPGFSERRACRLVGADRKMVRHRAPHAPDTTLPGRLRELANERRRFGCWRLFVLLRREGELSGINRIYRLCRDEGFSWFGSSASFRADATTIPVRRDGQSRPDLEGG